MAFDSSALQSEFEKWFSKLKANDQKLSDMINEQVDNIDEVVATKEVLKKIWLQGDDWVLNYLAPKKVSENECI
jgi:uncharacterized protein YdcH (DUF465 family)